jgi:hypothetical protein
MTDKAFAKEQYKRLAEFNGFHALTSEAVEDYLCAIQIAGAFPKLDRHLELLGMRIRLKDRMPEALLKELHQLTEELRFERIGPQLKHSAKKGEGL